MTRCFRTGHLGLTGVLRLRLDLERTHDTLSTSHEPSISAHHVIGDPEMKSIPPLEGVCSSTPTDLDVTGAGIAGRQPVVSHVLRGGQESLTLTPWNR